MSVCPYVEHTLVLNFDQGFKYYNWYPVKSDLHIGHSYVLKQNYTAVINVHRPCMIKYTQLGLV